MIYGNFVGVGPLSGLQFDSGYVDANGYLHLTINGEDIEGFTPFYVGADATFTTDETLILENGMLRVNTTNEAEQDNTLPMTSAGVYTQLGNIEALLSII